MLDSFGWASGDTAEIASLMMARAKSPEKRQAILRAAVCEIAQVGLGASTARIAKGAGLAEGTMFTYFSSKDDLLNELYIELKTEAYRRIQAGFPQGSGLRDRARHIWTEYLRWAMENPDERKVSVLLNLSAVVSAATRERVGAEREAVAQTMVELGERGAFQDLPPGFASSAMLAMQEAVMEMAAKKPRQKTMLIERAFDAFWRMAK
jgi:AcrR family transcriptional regulator